MAWNLADEINTDENVDSLFDSLPTQTKALERDEAIRVVDAGGDLNTSPKGSFAPNSDGPMKLAPVLESPKEKAVTDSALGEVQSDLGKNVLETFEAPKIQAAGKEEALPDEEYEEEPEEEYLGRTLHAGATLIASLEDAKLGRTGRNAREVAREKALDNQAIEAVKNELRRNLAGVSYPPEVYDILALRQGGGIRPAEEITELIRIRNNRGVQVLNDEGREAFVPANNWEDVMKVYDLRSAQQRKLAVSGKTEASDPLKSATEIQNLLSKFTDESGNPLAGKEAIVDGLNSQLDTAIGAPTGVAAYSYRYGRISDRADKLQRAMDAGVALGDITKDQLPQEIARLNQEQVALSAEKAPYFKDRESLAKWLSDSNTRNLPYFTDVGSTRALVKATTDPNVMEIWSPTESTWGRMDVNKPVPPNEDEVLKDKISKLTPKKDEYIAPAGRGRVLTSEQRKKLEQEKIAADKNSSLVKEKAKLESMIYSYQGRQKKLKYDANDPSAQEVLNKINSINQQLQ